MSASPSREDHKAWSLGVPRSRYRTKTFPGSSPSPFVSPPQVSKDEGCSFFFKLLLSPLPSLSSSGTSTSPSKAETLKTSFTVSYRQRHHQLSSSSSKERTLTIHQEFEEFRVRMKLDQSSKWRREVWGYFFTGHDSKSGRRGIHGQWGEG